MSFKWTRMVISTDIPTLLWSMSKAQTYTKKSVSLEIYHSQNDGFEYEVLIDLSKGLAHIHSHGVVHRDLKPSNILIDEDGRCIITDFGIVKELNSDVEKSTVLVGTWAYASPEQITGQELDHRSDLYSLGIILYAMLCSRRPFAASNMAGYSKLHSEQPPRPPSDFIPEIPTVYEEICLKLLSQISARTVPICTRNINGFGRSTRAKESHGIDGGTNHLL